MQRIIRISLRKRGVNTYLPSTFPAYQRRLGCSVDLAFKGDGVAVATPQISKLPRNHRQSEHIPVQSNIFIPFLPSFNNLFFFFKRFPEEYSPVSDPRFLHFLLLPLTWKQKDRFSSKRNRHPPFSSYLSRRSAKKSRLWPPHGSSALLRNTSP